ncbi:hypothetical protein PSACC_02863 [Paramicrosporidium saccamoebae]|uniref:PHD-type domain-containing protein n=1 Tax=Paramicrosporidium saccamoebae TaxID=1246581 RepID=A0A2H9THY7_9FUNG|nr:hypothetical protein PSACC_02863 [Paramicrosporidium saccamoebae]
MEDPVRWTRFQLRQLCRDKKRSKPVAKCIKSARRGNSKKGNPPKDMAISTPQIDNVDTWNDYINLFSCDQCNVQIREFRLYCRYCEKSSLDEWNYESYDLCPDCYQKAFPAEHPHPRESFAIRHMSYFNRDVSTLIPDGRWEGVLLEKSNVERLCAFCHENETANEPFIPFPMLRLRKTELTEQPSQQRDYFHRPYFYTHHRCAILSPEVYHCPTPTASMTGYYNVAAALHRARSLKCTLCRRSGATIGCFHVRCNRSFHVTCTERMDELANGAVFWCEMHRDGWADVWSCDACGVEMDDNWFSCATCKDYYNSFDLCTSCYERNDWSHDHSREDFIATQKAQEDPNGNCESPNGNCGNPSVSLLQSTDRSNGPVITEPYAHSSGSVTAELYPQSNGSALAEIYSPPLTEFFSLYNGPALADLYSLDLTSTIFDIHNRAPRSETTKVLSNFLGRGTDAIEATLLGRAFLGIDVNATTLELALRNCPDANVQLGDSRQVPLEDGTVGLVLSHPPYYKCIVYSTAGEAPGDLSRSVSLDDFCVSMRLVAAESRRVLMEDGRIVLCIGDNRESRHVIPVTLRVLQEYLRMGFVLEEYIVKRQRCCAGTAKSVSLSTMFGFLLLTHEIIIVLGKTSTTSRPMPINLLLSVSETKRVISASVGIKPCKGTIWMVPSACRDISTHLQNHFSAVFGVVGTMASILSASFDYHMALPSGPFRTTGEILDLSTDFERKRRENMTRNASFLEVSCVPDVSDKSSVISLLIAEPGVPRDRRNAGFSMGGWIVSLGTVFRVEDLQRRPTA